MTIDIRNLTVMFGPRRALQDVSLTVLPGRVTALLGPNAAGKSTLLRAAVGLIQGDRGEVSINGRNTRRLPPRGLARIAAYVPQRSHIAAAFTVREVVALGQFAQTRDSDRVHKALECMALEQHADRVIHELSVGQQQRVALARALAQVKEDGVLLLDEPTSAMDLSHQERALTVLRERAAAGATVLLAMHDLTVTARFADDVCLLANGSVAAQGSSADVMTPEALSTVFGVRFAKADVAGMATLIPVGSTSQGSAARPG